MTDPVVREFLLGFWKIHILHHAEEHGVYGQWMLEELQRHGYVVLRVLAADVVERMEDVLDRILAAVDHCLSTAGRTLQGGDPSRDGDRHD